jgi:hypothetical protein
VGNPAWWYNIHRSINTAFLIASGLALVSGKAIKSSTITKGLLNNYWYSLHLIAWITIILFLAAHLLVSDFQNWWQKNGVFNS